MKKTSKIVDKWGRPIETGTLDAPQTEQDAKVASLRRHYSEHPSSGLTVSKLARIMKEAEQGNLISQCELAEDMEEKDAHIQSELSKRKMALQGVDWVIKPPRNATTQEIADAELLHEMLEDATWLDDLIFDASDAILKGFSCCELNWAYDGQYQYIDNYQFRDPSWFQTNPEHRNQIMLRDGSYEGLELAPFGWVQHIARAKSGYLSRSGLARVLAWPYLFKNYSVRDLAEFLEIYGLPVRLGKYSEGATSSEKATLLRAVMQIGHNAGGIIPKGMDIDFQQAADGQSDPFMSMMGWCEKSQSKAILGGTLTSQADGKTSTNALGNVHNEVREEIRNFDLKRLAATLTNDIIYPLYALNCKSFNSPRRKPRFEFDVSEAEDIKYLAESIPALVGLGMQIPTQWLHDKTQIPKPTNGEDILGANSLTKPTVTPQQETALKATTPQLDTIDNQVTRLDKDATPLLEDMVKPVREMVENATSLDELREDLLSLQKAISVDEFGETIAQAMAAAELLGMSDIEEEV